MFFRSDRGVVIITKRKGLAAAGVVALIAAGSAACGTAQATPQGKVQNAFLRLADQKSVTLDLSFDASADQIYTALQGEDDFTKADAQLLADLHATLGVSSDKPIGSVKAGDKGSSVGFLVSDDSLPKQSLFELRSVDKTLYLRADVKAVAKLADSTSDGSDGDDSAVAELDQFLAQTDQLPASAGAIKAALKGDWIKLDTNLFASFAKSLAATGDSGAPAPTPSLDAAAQAKLITAVKNALSHNATFSDLGSRDGADHVQVSVQARPLAKELKTGLIPALKAIPGFDASDLNGLDDTPNKIVKVDVAVKGGSISAITVDLAQFDDTAHGALPLKLGLDSGAAQVSAPSGAVELRPEDLVSLFTSGLNGGDSEDSSDSGAFDDSLFDSMSAEPVSLTPADLSALDLSRLPAPSYGSDLSQFSPATSGN